MPEFFVNGQPVSAEPGQTVLSAALAAGFFIPYFCWHPQLSTAGNCRMCMVEVEGQGLDIACNMPVSAGMKVLTDSPAVAERRKEILQLILLNHPVDCGVCDKAGECSLQDYHYEFNGELSTSIGSSMSQNGCAQTATPPASWIAAIASATVGVVRRR